jgi:hypothetical protein
MIVAAFLKAASGLSAEFGIGIEQFRLISKP